MPGRLTAMDIEKTKTVKSVSVIASSDKNKCNQWTAEQSPLCAFGIRYNCMCVSGGFWDKLDVVPAEDVHANTEWWGNPFKQITNTNICICLICWNKSDSIQFTATTKTHPRTPV